MKVSLQKAVLLIALTPVAAISTTVQASELSAYTTLTTEYLYRGITNSDRNPALQFGVDYQHDSNLFVGAWASTINLRTGRGSRDFETSYYAGYHHELSKDWAATLTLLRYAYPGANGIHSYDHNETLLSVSWKETYALEYAHTEDVYGLGRSANHIQLSADWPLGNGWILGINVGRNDLSRIGRPKYLHANVGASTRLSRFSFDFRLYGSENVSTPQLGSFTAGTRFVASVSTAF